MATSQNSPNSEPTEARSPGSEGVSAVREKSENATQDMSETAEEFDGSACVKALEDLVAPGMKKSAQMLAEITTEQNALLRDMTITSGIVAQANVQFALEFVNVMQSMPDYTAKLQAIKGEIAIMVEKTRRLKQRAQRLKASHDADTATRQRQEEMLQKELLARPASRLQGNVRHE